MESPNYILGFVDILGYKDLADSQKIDDIYEALLATTDALAQIKANGDKESLGAQMNVRILGDTMIFIFDLRIAPSKVLNFIKIIVIFSRLFIQETSYFVRGGVAIGSYTDKEFGKNESRFMYGSALSKAVELERKAVVPRILVSSEVRDFINAHKGQLLQDEIPILESSDGSLFLDYYWDLGNKIGLDPKDALSQICKAVYFQAEKNRSKSQVLEKYHWFQRYHNMRVKKLYEQNRISGVKEYLIEIPYVI